MTIKELNKIIEAYPDKTELEQTTKELFKTISSQAYQAGMVDGINQAMDILKKGSK